MTLGWLRQPMPVLINALAAWRLAHLLTVEELQPIRAWRDELRLRLQSSHRARLRRIGEHRALTIPERVSAPPLQPLTDCPVCIGFWTAALVVLLASTPIVRRIWRPLAAALAMSMLPIAPTLFRREE